MVDRNITDQLDSPMPDKRKAAIQQLARTKDLEAIRFLEAVERLDSDSSVRDLAKKAIAYIQRQNEDLTLEAPAPVIADERDQRDPKAIYAAGSIMAEYASRIPDPEEEAPPEKLTEKPELIDVPEARQRAAKGALEMAGRAVFDEQMGRCVKYLIEAFKLNPNLKSDPYAIGLAATSTGLHKVDAIKAIEDGSALDLFDKSELVAKTAKKKTDSTVVEEVRPPATWGTAIVDLLIYGLINAVIIGVMVIVMTNFIISAIQNDPEMQAQLAQSGMPTLGLIDAISQVAVMGMIVYALFYGLVAIVSLFVTSFLIHVVSTVILRGTGTLPDLIHRTALFLGIMTALIVMAQIAGLFLPLVTDPIIGIVIWGVAFFLSIWSFIGYIRRVGKAYDMGSGRGCAALFLSSVLLTIFGVLCFAVLGQAFTTQLDLFVSTQSGVMTFITPTP